MENQFDPYEYLQRTLQVTEEFARRQIERKLTLEYAAHALYRFGMVLYATALLAVIPSGYYEVSDICRKSLEAERRGAGTHASFTNRLERSIRNGQ